MALTIGKLANKADVTIETIRHYQRMGLLIEPDKPSVGYRQYTQNAIYRIRFIKRAQQSGFTLKEISELLSLDSGHCKDVKKMAEKKRQKIAEQIRDLTTSHQVLDKLIADCTTNPTTNHCPIIRFFQD